jgi:hypothetical protein
MPILDFLPAACQTNQHFQLPELVVRAFRCNDGGVADVAPFITLLNCPRLVGEGRQLVWELILERRPTLLEFSARYAWMGDWVEQVDYLLGLEPSEAVAARVVVCAQNAMQAFDRSYRWLREWADGKLRECAGVILKVETGEYWETVADYIGFLCQGKSDEQAGEIIRPFCETMGLRVAFLNDVFEDVLEGAVGSEDIGPLLPPLRVLAVVKRGGEPILGELAKLGKKCGDVRDRVEVPELEVLSELIRAVVQ